MKYEKKAFRLDSAGTKNSQLTDTDYFALQFSENRMVDFFLFVLFLVVSHWNVVIREGRVIRYREGSV